MKQTKSPHWDRIFKALETWRAGFLAAGEGEDPAVTALALERPAGPGKSWTVLVSTVLSLRTKDDVTRQVSEALLKKAPGPAALLKLREEEIARTIYPAGFYRTKAAHLRQIAAILLEQHQGQVPSDMDALLALPGVGRKVANLVLTEAFDMDGICVDTHVHRISNRCGWVDTPSPEKTEIALREILPRPYWKRINSLLVLYGQQLCRPLSPFCSRCVIPQDCPRRGVDRSR